MTTHQEQPKQSTVSIAYLGGLMEYLKEQGVDEVELLRGTHLQPGDFHEKHRRVDAETYFYLFNQAVRLTQDPLVGLKVGTRVKPGNYGVIGYVLMACRTFGEVLMRSGRYQKLVGDIGYSDMQFFAEEAEIVWHPNYEDIPPAVVEEHMASIITYARWLAGQDKQPLEVFFMHQPQGGLDTYHQIFQCQVGFNHAYTGVRFPIAFTQLQLPQFDLDLCTLLDQKAQQALADLESESQFIGKVKKIIRNALPDGVPTLSQVSQVLEKSEKELQRELSQFNTNFKSLLDETRKQLAQGYISNPDIELNELAFLLGFSEQSAFQRAFKRWTGTTPGRHRKSLV